jgi:xanthine dehydrogenase YagS FAD-binding subunit
MARNSDVAENPIIRDRYPVLAALLAGASPQLRNMATVGGNLMQRTRCYYFRDVAFACNKRVPGSGCPAIEGFNRTHAILGTSNSCIATHPSDMAVALVALDAVVHIQGPNGSRCIPMTDFHLPPGNTPEQEAFWNMGVDRGGGPTKLWVRGSLSLPEGARSRFLRVCPSVCRCGSRGRGWDHPFRTTHRPRGVATKPWRTYEVEDALVGAPLMNLLSRRQLPSRYEPRLNGITVIRWN